MKKNKNLIAIHGKIGAGKDTVEQIINLLLANPHFTNKAVISFLGRDFDRVYQNKKFADKLKDIVCLMLGCTRAQLEDRDFKNKELGEEWEVFRVRGSLGHFDKLYANREDAWKRYNEFSEGNADFYHNKLTPRLLLQLLGTECGRQIIHPDIWVNALFSEYLRKDVDMIAVKKGENLLEALKRGLNEDVYPKWVISDLRFPNEFEAIKKRCGILIKIIRDEEQILKDKGIHIPKHLVKPEHESETALDQEDRWDYIIENNYDLENLVIKVREILAKEGIL